MSITLYLLNKKGYEVLKALTTSAKNLKSIDLVVGARDKGNDEDFYDEIRSLCENYNINYIDRNNKIVAQSKYSLAIGWRWLINDEKNLIVLHDSCLPKYRGFSPVVNMLINGENYLGATAIWATDKMDEGEIIFQKKVNITYPLKIHKAIEIIAELYVEIVLKIMTLILENKKLASIPQIANDATYSVWRNEYDYFIDWTRDASEIVRFVDAVGYPYGGAKTKTEEGEVILILECVEVNNIISEIYAPGKLIMFDEEPIILCGRNAIKILKVLHKNNEPFIFKKFRTRLN
jgi:methionyl-tRNA formyltransferase